MINHNLSCRSSLRILGQSRLASLVLVTLMVAVSFYACGGSPESPVTEPEPTPTSRVEDVAPEDASRIEDARMEDNTAEDDSRTEDAQTEDIAAEEAPRTEDSQTEDIAAEEAPRTEDARTEDVATEDAPVGDASRISLDEYMEQMLICSGEDAETAIFEEGVSLREFAATLGRSIQQMESVEPPVEIADYHFAVLSFQRAIKGSIDDYPGPESGQSEDEFILEAFFPLGLQYQPDIDEAIAGMDPGIRSRMVAGGCIDEETSGSIPTRIDREDIPVGGSIQGTLEAEEKIGTLQFQAEMGQKYLIEISWESFPEIWVLIKDPPDPTVDSITMLNPESSPLVSRWTAPGSGTFLVDVGAYEGSGSYAISISIDASPDAPKGVSAAWEGSEVKVGWSPVEGAEFYKVYHDDLGPGCRLEDGGRPIFCDQLAANVVGTDYTHASPDRDDNFYWVVACNSEGCSKIDSMNPVTAVGDAPADPSTTGGPCRAGATLKPGEFCTVSVPSVDAGTDVFEVGDDGACYGNICAEDQIILPGFIAYANFDGTWLITGVLEGSPGE